MRLQMKLYLLLQLKGMTSKYDLEILENTKTINEFDILINKINILQQYAKLYFKIKN